MKLAKNRSEADFGLSQFLKAAIPSYVIPLCMSFSGGYFSKNPILMRASYTTIATPSLVATVIGFVALMFFQKRQLFIIHRAFMALIIAFTLLTIAVVVIVVCKLEEYVFDILPSVGLGGIVVALTNPLKKVNPHEN